MSQIVGETDNLTKKKLFTFLYQANMNESPIHRHLSWALSNFYIVLFGSIG